MLAKLTPEAITATSLANEPILTRQNHAPGNDAPIGGIKITAQNGWFAARPSGTEDVYKVYAESFLGAAHLKKIAGEAQAMIDELVRND